MEMCWSDYPWYWGARPQPAIRSPRQTTDQKVWGLSNIYNSKQDLGDVFCVGEQMRWSLRISGAGCGRKLIGMSWHQISVQISAGITRITAHQSVELMTPWQGMMWDSVINQDPIIVYLRSDRAELREIDQFLLISSNEVTIFLSFSLISLLPPPQFDISRSAEDTKIDIWLCLASIWCTEGEGRVALILWGSLHRNKASQQARWSKQRDQ